MQKSKALLGALVLFLSTALGVVPAAWATRDLADLKVTVEIAPNGNAHFTEEWTVYEDGTGSEIFKRLGRLPKTMEIRDYKVSENGKPYTFEPNWKPKADWDKKYQKYGVVKGYSTIELGWGRGTRGMHTYTLEYTVTNFIMNLKDAQVINWQFLNDHLSALPQGYQYVIKSPKFGPKTVEDIRVYGNYAYHTYQNNQILLRSDRALLSSEYLVVLAKLPAGTFDTKTNVDQTYLETLEISNTTDPNKNDIPKPLLWGGGILLALGAAGAIIGLPLRSRYKSKKQRTETARRKENLLPDTFKDTNIYPQVPKDTPEMIWQMAVLAEDSFYSARMKKHLLTAYVLKWILEGRVKATKITSKWKYEGTTGIQLDHDQYQQLDRAEQKLYKLLLDASGPDNTLAPDELKEYCNKYPDLWPESQSGLAIRGQAQLASQHLSEKVPLGDSFQHSKIERLSPTGAKHYQQALGFKNYLKDFTLIDEREVTEVQLWKQYLIYGALFDLTETVYQQLKKVIPEELAKYSLNDRIIRITVSWAPAAESGTESSNYNSSDSYSSGSGGGGGGGGSAGGSSGGGFR
ncbi:hypothetical protein BSR29_05515 [Boudabousia liubingyangii]|uniref:DUF2207 domain-containing protein n=1 Tax=Boudabousia liubingyangii TaxID=1921764 RepID=A0A1Q5PLL6_9ACTO|nr:DUF2207 domain-containing protein [Boudabousia liubingyangii]OKL47939.1 hypothetical protein BSR29_05515 [Boudabousia liubingyangii]